MSAIKLLRLLLPLLLLPPAALVHPADKVPVVTTTRHLALGRFVAASGGTIALTPAGVRSKTGGVVLLAGGTIASASFTLTESGNGKSLRWTTITLPGPTTLASGGATMTLNNFTSNPANTFIGTTERILTVGATLTVGPNQAPGNYAGAFSVTVNYE